MREDVLDVVGERPHLVRPRGVDRRRSHHLVVVVDQLQQCLFDVARTGLEQDVAAPDLLVERHFLEHRHDALAERPVEQVVEELRGVGAGARIGVRERPLCGADVAPRIDQRQQPVDAVLGADDLLLERQHQRRPAREPVAREQVVVQREIVEVVASLFEGERFDGRARRSSARRGRAAAARAPTRLVAQEPILLLHAAARTSTVFWLGISASVAGMCRGPRCLRRARA